LQVNLVLLAHHQISTDDVPSISVSGACLVPKVVDGRKCVRVVQTFLLHLLAS
jgi:hypothetical protein